MLQANAQTQQSKQDLQRLIKEGSLPPKMELKLRYLLNSIQRRQTDNHLIEGLPQFQKLSLQTMDTSTKVSLFNSIIGCLAGRQIHVYFAAEKATLKSQSPSASSLSCYLSGDSQLLKIAKNKEASTLYFEMSMDKIMVSKIYRQEKKVFSFGIAYDDVKYRLRFEEEGRCARIHGALLSIIREKRSLVAQQTQKHAAPQSKEKQGDDEPEADCQQQMFEQEREYLQSLHRRVGQINLADSQRFQLHRNTDWGKILINSKENQLKILMYLQKCTVAGVIQSYIQFSAWNTHVEQFRVINKIRRNTYLCSLLLKQQGLTSHRHTYLAVTYFRECADLSGKQPDALKERPDAQKERPDALKEKPDTSKEKPDALKERHYLLLDSVATFGQTASSFYPFTMSQIIQFSKIEEGGVFISLLSKIDFNVYEYLNSSLSKSLVFLSEIGSIALLSRERDLLGASKKQLFQFNSLEHKFPSKLLVEGDESNADSGRKNSVISDIGQSPIRQDQNPPPECPLAELAQILNNHNNKELIEKRILQIIDKRLYQKYYLRQPFDQLAHEQPYAASDYHLHERTNFFELGSMWKFSSSEELIFTDQEIIKLQKGALKLIVKQITANLMAGKSIMSMSLPVQLFSNDSALEAFAKTFGFVPCFMAQAVKQTQVVEQIKYVSAAFMFILACKPSVNKPFNPILGETYEASLGGIPVYFEQISHHPPISSFLMKTDKFQAHGNFQIVVDLGMNSAYSKLPTFMKVKIYNTNAEYLIRYPDVQVGGIMFGDRTLRVMGKGFVLEKNSGTYLEHSIAKAKKGLYEYKDKVRNADLVGGIFKISPETITRLLTADRKKTVQGIKPEQALQRYSLMSGKWYGDLLFDGVMIKSFKDGPFPLKLQRPTVLLPSDCTFRLDVMYRRWRDFKTSNQEKEVLQNLQRRDRRLREKHMPKKH